MGLALPSRRGQPCACSLSAGPCALRDDLPSLERPAQHALLREALCCQTQLQALPGQCRQSHSPPIETALQQAPAAVCKGLVHVLRCQVGCPKRRLLPGCQHLPRLITLHAW